MTEQKKTKTKTQTTKYGSKLAARHQKLLLSGKSKSGRITVNSVVMQCLFTNSKMPIDTIQRAVLAKYPNSLFNEKHMGHYKSKYALELRRLAAMRIKEAPKIAEQAKKLSEAITD